MSIKQYSLKADGSRRLAPSFTVREFRCRDGSDVVMIDESLVVLLQCIREHFGKPITRTWPPTPKACCPAGAAWAATRSRPDAPKAGYMWTPGPTKAAGRSKGVIPMESIISAILAGAVTLIGVLIANSRSQAVTDTKLEELTREVREHNNFARRVPILEEQMKVANHRIADLENHERMKERN